MGAVVILEKLDNSLSIKYMANSMEMPLRFLWMRKKNQSVSIRKCTQREGNKYSSLRAWY